MTLSDIIKEHIREKGPIPFRDYMEMALYYPSLGYYTSSRNKIGTDGDYYTSAELSPLFGELVGKQLEEMWTLLGREDFTVVECGAGKGTLCRDILGYLKNNSAMYRRLKYCIVERSPVTLAHERSLPGAEVCRYGSLSELPPFTGCVLSNELIDNFSVHRVVMNKELMEVYVDHQDAFTEVLRPASGQLKEYLAELNISLPEGAQTEINLQALEWLRDISAVLKKGFVLTIDYGYSAPEMKRYAGRQGTLLCYHRHRISDRLYESIGEQDITAHVNFSALRHWGDRNGLSCCGYTDQARFLLALGLTDCLRREEARAGSLKAATTLRMIHTLLVDMGGKFKVFAQQKGVSPAAGLSGMQFATRRL
ncbi:MAG: SAM-dependent methyltransferase [Bacteroidota bacterium]